MGQQMVLEKLQEIISFYIDEPLEIKMDTHVYRDLIINSFDYTNIITDIEDEFEITIDDLTIFLIKDLVQLIIDLNGKQE